MKRTYAWVAAVAGLSMAASSPGAGAGTEEASTLSYVRLYTDASGMSHFADEHLVLTPIPAAAGGAAGPEDLLSMHRLGDLKGVMFAQLKAGASEDWHVAPRRQFMVCLRGLVEITASDGEKRSMKPGQFMLLEDLSGRGHRTHAAGAEDHVALALPVPEGIPAR